MEIFIVVLILLICIGISNIINRFIPFVPIPLIQITIGIIITALPLGIHMTLEPELFLVLFIAPLLFNDAKRISRDALWNLRIPILLMSLGLVFVTVFILGYFIHWMVPGITLSAAFALAAILSPTDAVAVQGLSKRLHLPSNIMHLLEGEALMNDASGLVAFKFAVAATLNGYFSITQVTVSFFAIALGGLLFGSFFSFLIIQFRRLIRRLGMEDVTIQMLIQILTPFLIYLIAEELGLSGILAVVAGGIIHGVEHDITESFMQKLKIVSESTWSVIIFILNGLVFLILGLQIPGVTKVIFKDDNFNNYEVMGYILAISILIFLIRFIWVYTFGEEKFKIKSSVIISLSGVRGAITLAGALSIPYVLNDGNAFPQRGLIIFIAAGVILFSLIEASVMLPFIIKREKHTVKRDKDKLMQIALIKIIHASIKILKEEMKDENKEATMHVISNYNAFIRNIYRNKKDSKSNLQSTEMKKDIYVAALRVEKKEIQKLMKTGKISTYSFRELEKKFNHSESILLRDFKHRFVLAIFIAKRVILKLFTKAKKSMAAENKEIEKALLEAHKAAIVYVRNQIIEENREASLEVILHYDDLIGRLRRKNQPNNSELFNKKKREIQFKAIEAQRKEVQLLFENGQISRETANRLRKIVNNWEATIME